MVKEIVAIFLLSKIFGKERTAKVSKRLKKYILIFSSALFFIVAIAHGVRVAFKIAVYIGNWHLPFWFSLIAVPITSYLAISLWKISNDK